MKTFSKKKIEISPPRQTPRGRCSGGTAASRIGLALISAVLSLLPASPGLALGKQYVVKKIAPGTFVWIPDDIIDQNGDPRFSRAGNVGFVITDQGVVVVDTTNNPFHAREVLYEIRQRTAVPVTLTVDTGSAGDEMLGNEVFAEQHSAILSTSAAADQMRLYEQQLARRMPVEPELPYHMRGIHFTLPDQTFQGEMSFAVGGLRIQVVSLSCTPSGRMGAGDAAVFLPQAKVVFLGSLYVNGYVPRIGSRDIRRWISVLGEVEKWDADTFIPGHGNPGTKPDLERFRGLLEWLQGRVQGEIRQGKSLVQTERELLGSSTLYLRARELAPETIAAVYEQLMSSHPVARDVQPVADPSSSSQPRPDSGRRHAP